MVYEVLWSVSIDQRMSLAFMEISLSIPWRDYWVGLDEKELDGGQEVVR